MTDDEFRQLRATMPWTEHSVAQGRQTLIQIIDRHGREVPLFTVVAFTLRMSRHLAGQPQKENGNA